MLIYFSGLVNPLLHRSFFYFEIRLKKIKNNLSKVLNTFENIMENGAFAPKEPSLHIP